MGGAVPAQKTTLNRTGMFRCNCISRWTMLSKLIIEPKSSKLFGLPISSSQATLLGIGHDTRHRLCDAGGVRYVGEVEMNSEDPSAMNTHRQIWVVVAVTAMLISAGCTRGPDTLYGVFWDNTASIEKLVAIDPSTGALTQVGAGITNCCFISSGVSTLDPDGDVFYFVGRESNPPGRPPADLLH
jgi:hypothetical protein